MYLLVCLLLLSDALFTGFFSRLMLTAEKKEVHLFAVGLLESVAFGFKLIAKGLRFALSTCRRHKEADNALMFRYFSFLSASSFTVYTVVGVYDS